MTDTDGLDVGAEPAEALHHDPAADPWTRPGQTPGAQGIATATDGEAPSDAGALFSGDRGQLPLETRRALVQLLQGPSVDGRRQARLWATLLRDEAVLRSRLHELFLDLVVDREQQVAFTRQAAVGELEAPVLLRRAALTFLESALVLYLRQRLMQGETQGERAVVARAEALEHLRVYERDRNVDHARFERQMDNAFEKAKKLGLLHKLRGGEERYEVSPTLKLLFPAEEILALTRTYQALAQGGAAAGAGEEEAPADAGDGEDLEDAP